VNETTVTVVGNLTADPDLRFSAAGAAWARFHVANTPRVFDRATGEYKDGEPLFVTCTVWREPAEHVAESLRKGARVIVVGRLRLSKWTDDNGEPRSAYGLEVDAVGPDLRFATAQVARTTQARGRYADEAPPDDQWEQATRERPAAPVAA
jgi:single-strand DNA-binding protein